MTGLSAECDAGTLQNRILTIRERKVILDADLARIYGVATKVLNQAVKRNADRFPSDFRFRLSPQEVEDTRSRIVTLKRDIYQRYRRLLLPPPEAERKAIGFGVKERRAQYRIAGTPRP